MPTSSPIRWRGGAGRSCGRTGDTSIDSRLLSVSVLNDLFAGFTDGPEEVWDVWCHVAVLHGDAARGSAPPAPAVLIDDLVDRVRPAETALLRSHASANADLARDSSARSTRPGSCSTRNRLVLPHIALYHWNRYGFTPDDRASMYTRMIHAWSPHD